MQISHSALLLWRAVDQACLIAQNWQLVLAKFPARQPPDGECIFGSTHSSRGGENCGQIFLLGALFSVMSAPPPPELNSAPRANAERTKVSVDRSFQLLRGGWLLFIEINFSSWALFGSARPSKHHDSNHDSRADQVGPRWRLSQNT
jgi:hypothetical protein